MQMPLREEEVGMAGGTGAAGMHEVGGFFFVEYLKVRREAWIDLPRTGDGIELPDVIKPSFVYALSRE